MNTPTDIVYIKPSRKPDKIIEADFGGDIMKQVIGKDGCYFKLTTKNTAVDYIWYNYDTKNIEIWGDNSSCLNSEKILTKRIFIIISKMITNDQNLSKICLDYYNSYKSSDTN